MSFLLGVLLVRLLTCQTSYLSDFFRAGPSGRNRVDRTLREATSLVRGAQVVGRRLAGTPIRHDFVADLLAFAQSPKSGSFDGADVHKHVVAAVIRLNEAIAFGSVKPLYGSHAHGIVPSQDRYSKTHFRRLVRSNFWKGRQRLNRLYRWIANVVRPKID